MIKKWYKSKAILAGAALIVYGVYCLATGSDESPDIIRMIIEGVGIIGLRAAIK